MEEAVVSAYAVYRLGKCLTVGIVSRYGKDDFGNGTFFEFFFEDFCRFRWVLSKNPAAEGTEDKDIGVLFRCNPVDKADAFFQRCCVFRFRCLSVAKSDPFVGRSTGNDIGITDLFVLKEENIVIHSGWRML